jgi:hypothetical protein
MGLFCPNCRLCLLSLRKVSYVHRPLGYGSRNSGGVLLCEVIDCLNIDANTLQSLSNSSQSWWRIKNLRTPSVDSG